MTRFYIVLMSLILLSFEITAQENNDDWKFSGQVQLRTEIDGRDFSNLTAPYFFTSMRTRLGVSKSLSSKVNFFVQFQDSRIFGEEGSTLKSINNIDLHQGYVTLTNPFEIPVEVQAGRFEVAYGTERFLGAVGWHYVGRSWDGVRFKFHPCFDLDLFALTQTQKVGYIGNASPLLYAYPFESKPSFSVYGFWSSHNFDQSNKLDVFGYYEVNRSKTAEGKNLLDQFTAGINHFGKYGKLSTTTEAAYQFGKMGGVDVAAYLLSVSGDYSFGSAKLGVGADILSGTDPKSTDKKVKSFNPAYGTNHKFYGFMDYFIGIPANTKGLGLNDFYLYYNVQPKESKFSGALALHHFMSNQKFTAAGKDLSAFGQEVDLTVKYNFVKGTSLTWGGSLFFPGDLMKEFFKTPAGNRDDISFWSYLMITANL